MVHLNIVKVYIVCMLYGCVPNLKLLIIIINYVKKMFVVSTVFCGGNACTGPYFADANGTCQSM